MEDQVKHFLGWLNAKAKKEVMRKHKIPLEVRRASDNQIIEFPRPRQMKSFH